MRWRRGAGWLAAALMLAAPAAGAQEATASSSTTAGQPAAAATTTARGGTNGLFLEPTLGFGLPVADAAYDYLIDISFVPAISVGWLFGLGDAAIGPEAWLTYTPLNVDDDDFPIRDADIYAGRFRVAGGARFQVDVGALYLFTHLGVGFELVHTNWEYYIGPLHYEDDESDGGLVILPGFGFGGRLTDWIGLTLRLDFPTAMHWDDEDGGVDFDYHSTDIEVDFGVTFFL